MSPERFTHTLVRSGRRLLIESACALCGESRLVSRHDGSLEAWESAHRCEAERLPKKDCGAAGAEADRRALKIVGGRTRRTAP